MQIRSKALEYLEKNPKKKMTVAQIAKAIKVSAKSLSAQLPKLEQMNDRVSREKKGKLGFVYWYAKRKPNGSSGKKSKSIGMDTPITNLLGGGTVAEQIVGMERQNQMYQQAFGQIAAILVQIGFIEEE